MTFGPSIGATLIRQTGSSWRAERLRVADRPPERARRTSRRGPSTSPRRPIAGQPFRPVVDRRREPLQAEQGRGAPAGGKGGIGNLGDDAVGQMRRARDVERCSHRLAERRRRRLRRQPGDDERGDVSGRGRTLKVDLGDDGERPPRAGESLRQVIAGDVLHDPPAGLEHLAAPRDRLHAEHMVARRAGLDPARAAHVAGEHAADRAAAARAAEEPARIHRLEGEHPGCCRAGAC